MTARIIIALVAIAAFVATLILDSRLAPIVGAAALLGVFIFGWWSNRQANDGSYRRAEQATRMQKETRTGPRTE
ncbi:hypothetical protein [Qipengyuania nanhaisediminis]|uniref:hypothetical protein n=1 Tax=Qipengyuania nanhaisediminis TaxID=604088 RepID=UPI0038B411E3